MSPLSCFFSRALRFSPAPSPQRSEPPRVEPLEARIAPAAAMADLSVVIDAPEFSETGDLLTYQVTVKNEGPQAATKVVLGDELPVGVTFVSAKSSQGTVVHQGDLLLVNVGTLKSGASATLTVRVTAPESPGRLATSANVQSAVNDPDTSQNSATANVDVLLEGSLSVADLSAQTATDLVNTILGPGVTVSNVQYKGTSHSAGTFSSTGQVVGFDSGIVLSSGDARKVIGPNKSGSITADNGLLGDVDLDTLTSDATEDATVLEFDFIPTTDTVSFQYVFSSDEYNEFANRDYNDVFGFFVNGMNAALLPGTTVPVSINNVNGGNPLGTNAQHPEYYINNSVNDGGAFINTEMDGMTVVLSVQAMVNPGVVNHIKLAIADTGDSALDSNVFIRAGSFTDGPTDADLEVTVSDAPDPVRAGQDLTYTATVTNNGPNAAFGVLLKSLLPDGVDFVSAYSSKGGATNLGANVVGNIGVLASGESATVTFVVKPSALGTLSLTSTALSSLDDPDTENNSATVSTDVLNLVTISNATVLEGDSGDTVLSFVVSLDQPDPEGVELTYHTASFSADARSATPGVDYEAVSAGTLSFGPAEKTKTIEIVIHGDTTGEQRERFLAVLDSVSSGAIDVGTAVGTIIDDDHHTLAVGAGSGSKVQVFDTRDGQLVQSFNAFETSYKGGVRVATGDVTGDGVDDIVVATGSGGSARVRIFDGTNTSPAPQPIFDFKPFGGFRGSLYVATGDVNGDGVEDLVVSTGSGSAAEVRIFDVAAAIDSGGLPTLLTKVQPFGKLNGGVHVAMGDLDGDGLADLIATNGIGAEVRVFHGDGTPFGGPLGKFRAFDLNVRGGLFASAGDLDGDGADDLAFSTATKGSSVNAFLVSGGVPYFLYSFNPFAGSSGVRVSMTDVNGDGIADIIASQGVGGGAAVRAIDGLSGSELLRLNPLNLGGGGVFVG